MSFQPQKTDDADNSVSEAPSIDDEGVQDEQSVSESGSLDSQRLKDESCEDMDQISSSTDGARMSVR